MRTQRYLSGYYNLISSAQSQNRVKSKISMYFEEHHIIPKSFGGTDQSHNLVYLTAKEHYIAHYLLTKFTSGNQYKKALWAFDHMNTVNKNNQKRFISASIYEKMKIEISNNHHMKDKKFIKEKYSGINNGMTKIFYVLNENGDLVHTFSGGFHINSSKMGLPTKALYKSSQNDGLPIYLSQPWQTPAKYIQYTGWSCIKYDLVEARKEYKLRYAKYHKQQRLLARGRAISKALKGKPKSESHKRALSNARLKYNSNIRTKSGI